MQEIVIIVHHGMVSDIYRSKDLENVSVSIIDLDTTDPADEETARKQLEDVKHHLLHHTV